MTNDVRLLFISHLYIVFGEIAIQITCLFLIALHIAELIGSNDFIVGSLGFSIYKIL